jgi:hypothetical protein
MSCSGENAAIAATRTHVLDGDASSDRAASGVSSLSLWIGSASNAITSANCPQFSNALHFQGAHDSNDLFDLPHSRRLVCQSFPRRVKRRNLLL